MISGVATVWIPVADFERALAFYEGVLELPVQKKEDGWAELDANGLRLGLNAREAAGAGGRGGAVVTFQPDDGIEAAVEKLRERGAQIAGEVSDHPWGRVATFKDSEGNDLQLYEPPSG